MKNSFIRVPLQHTDAQLLPLRNRLISAVPLFGQFAGGDNQTRDGRTHADVVVEETDSLARGHLLIALVDRLVRTRSDRRWRPPVVTVRLRCKRACYSCAPLRVHGAYAVLCALKLEQRTRQPCRARAPRLRFAFDLARVNDRRVRIPGSERTPTNRGEIAVSRHRRRAPATHAGRRC